MNEFILAEFAFLDGDIGAGNAALNELGDDFVRIDGVVDIEGTQGVCYMVSGRINSATATAIKLSNTLLSNAMRISYISDELKNKYRR